MKSRLLVIFPFVAALASCTSNDAPRATAVGPSTQASTAASLLPLPKAVGKPVLVMHPARSAAAGIPLDLVSLEAMSTRSVNVYEPFVKKTLQFTGVPLQELLDRAGMKSGTLNIHALDDYTFDAKVSDLAGAILATRSAGAAIPVAEGGPIRVIFEPGGPLAKNTDAWVWSVDSMTQVSSG